MKSILLRVIILLYILVSFYYQFLYNPASHLSDLVVPVKVLNNDDTIILDGTINNDNVDTFIKEYKLKKPSYVILRSTGGDLVAGTKLAQFVLDNDIFVYVNEYCASACTFAFFVANHKDMAENAVIGLHNLSIEPYKDMFSGTEVATIVQKTSESAGAMMLLYSSSGIPTDVLLKVLKMFGDNAILLTRKELVGYNIIKPSPTVVPE